MSTNPSCILVIFGAAGDLTKRKLIPALYNLKKGNLLSDSFAVIGVATEEKQLVLSDDGAAAPVDMPMNVLLGKPPKMHRDVKSVAHTVKPIDLTGVDLQKSCIAVLSHPTVASKRFLITIGDRTVGGLTHRDQMVGPWQVPVADCAVTLADYQGFAGEAMSMGERTPLAAIDAPASGRMAVAEAITNLLAAAIELPRVKLSANWMAACGEPGEADYDSEIYDPFWEAAVETGLPLSFHVLTTRDTSPVRGPRLNGFMSIIRANQDVIGDIPDAIRVGMKLTIPPKG